MSHSLSLSDCVCLCQTHIIMNTLIYDVVNTQFYCDIVLFECFHNFSFASKSCLVIFGIFPIQHSNRYTRSSARTPHTHTQRTSIHITSLSMSHIKTLNSFDRAAEKSVHIFLLTAFLLYTSFSRMVCGHISAYVGQYSLLLSRW